MALFFSWFIALVYAIIFYQTGNLRPNVAKFLLKSIYCLYCVNLWIILVDYLIAKNRYLIGKKIYSSSFFLNTIVSPMMIYYLSLENNLIIIIMIIMKLWAKNPFYHICYTIFHLFIILKLINFLISGN